MRKAYISPLIRRRVAEQARYRCGYCQTQATVNALQLNRTLAVRARRRWVKAGWHPPKEEEVPS